MERRSENGDACLFRKGRDLSVANPVASKTEIRELRQRPLGAGICEKALRPASPIWLSHSSRHVSPHGVLAFLSHPTT